MIKLENVNVALEGNTLSIKLNDEDLAKFKETIQQAHMAGQADAGVDPSYSDAQRYCDQMLVEEITLKEIFNGSEGCWSWNYYESEPIWFDVLESAKELRINLVLSGEGFPTEQQCKDAHEFDLLKKRYVDYWDEAWINEYHCNLPFHYISYGGEILSDEINLVPNLARFPSTGTAKDCIDTFTQSEINKIMGWD